MNNIFLLYRNGELLEVFDTYEEAQETKYNGKYSGHWDSFRIEEIEVNKKDLQKVFNSVINFMIENDVTCEETIYQCDWVIENAYDFMADLFKNVKTYLPIDDYE
jgi:hypothetical protein